MSEVLVLGALDDALGVVLLRPDADDGARIADRLSAATMSDARQRHRSAIHPRHFGRSSASAGPRMWGWCTIASPFATEILSASGVDRLCIDLQHGLIGERADALDGARLPRSAARPVTRVPWNEPSAIMRALDAGADGVSADGQHRRAGAPGRRRDAAIPRWNRSWGPSRLDARATALARLSRSSRPCSRDRRDDRELRHLDEILDGRNGQRVRLTRRLAISHSGPYDEGDRTAIRGQRMPERIGASSALAAASIVGQRRRSRRGRRTGSSSSGSTLPVALAVTGARLMAHAGKDARSGSSRVAAPQPSGRRASAVVVALLAEQLACALQPCCPRWRRSSGTAHSSRQRARPCRRVVGRLHRRRGTSSGIPPRSLTSTGTPAASASSATYGHGSSQREGTSIDRGPGAQPRPACPRRAGR